MNQTEIREATLIERLREHAKKTKVQVFKRDFLEAAEAVEAAQKLISKLMMAWREG